MNNYIGVDPGFSGGLAVLNAEGIIEVIDMPIIKTQKIEIDGSGIVSFLEKHSPCLVGIEKCQSMPGQGISSTGRYMAGYGRLRGICEGMRIPYTLIHPRTWKRVMMPDMTKDKGQSIIRVKQLFPGIADRFTRKKDHGICDSILIAEYCRRTA